MTEQISLTSWQWLRVFNLMIAAICGAIVFREGQTWSAVFNAALGGFNLSSAIYATLHMRMITALNRSNVIFDEVMQMHAALLADKVGIVVEGMMLVPGDDEPEPKPKLH